MKRRTFLGLLAGIPFLQAPLWAMGAVRRFTLVDLQMCADDIYLRQNGNVYELFMTGNDRRHILDLYDRECRVSYDPSLWPWTGALTLGDVIVRLDRSETARDGIVTFVSRPAGGRGYTTLTAYDVVRRVPVGWRTRIGRYSASSTHRGRD